MSNNTFPINLDTKHDIFLVSKGRFVFLLILRWVMYGGTGIFLSYSVLYNKCLFNEHCNTVVVTFFSILSLGCFANCGLAIDKFTNISVGKP
jgi:hypothetical protein